MIWMYVIMKDNASETQKQKQKLIGSSSVTVRPFSHWQECTDEQNSHLNVSECVFV
jgi:hypothetical protein